MLEANRRSDELESRLNPENIGYPLDRAWRVLVVVPSFNEGNALRATVLTLLAAGREVLVVDDGSRDDTKAIRALPISTFGMQLTWVRVPLYRLAWTLR